MAKQSEQTAVIDASAMLSQLLKSSAVKTIGEFVTVTPDLSRDKAWQFELTAEGTKLHQDFLRAFQIADDKGPKDREVLQLMEPLNAKWSSHPGVVENGINELIEAKDADAAVEKAASAVGEWFGLLKAQKVKEAKHISSAGSAGLLFIQLLANYEFALERANKLEEALAVANLSRLIEPSDPENLLSSIVSIAIRIGEPMDAIKELEPLADSPAPFVLYNRALAYFAAGQLENADGAIKTAVRNWPQVAQGLGREWTSGTPMPRPGEAISELQVLYGYYEVFGATWQAVPGALEWLRSEEAAFQRGGGRSAPHARLSTSGFKSDAAGHIVPAQARPETQQELLRKAVVVGKDEFIRFLEVTPDHFVYDLTEVGKEIDERHQAIYREDMKYNERTEAIREIVRDWPGHLAAVVALGRQLAGRDKFSEAIDVLQNGIFEAQKFWPEDFVGKGFIESDWASNKHLLTAYAHITVDCESANEWESAQAFAQDFIQFNPKDGFGVRQKAIEIEMELKNPKAALEVIESATDPLSAYNMFGKALAYYKLENKKKADAALQEAVGSRPLIYRELTSDHHRMPPKYNPAFVYYFSKEEAYNYHMLWSKRWRTTFGALAWLRKDGRRMMLEARAKASNGTTAAV